MQSNPLVMQTNAARPGNSGPRVVVCRPEARAWAELHPVAASNIQAELAASFRAAIAAARRRNLRTEWAAGEAVRTRSWRMLRKAPSSRERRFGWTNRR